MNCQDINEKMSLYIDNLLEDSERKKFEKHLSECSACREEYQLITENIKLCNDIPEVKLPVDFKEGLHKKLLTEKRKNKLIRTDWRTYGVVAAAVLIVFVSAFQNMFMKDTSQDTAQEESSSIGSKWTLANDSDEKLQKEMNTAGSPQPKADDAAQEPLTMAADQDTSAIEDSTHDFGESDVRSTDMFLLAAPSSVDTAKSYEGSIHVSSDSLETVEAFIEPFMESHPDIVMNVSADNESADWEIKLTMPSELFTGCLDYITQYSNITEYHVDIRDYSEEYDALNSEIMALNRLAAKIENDMGLTENEEENESNEKRLEQIETVQIPEKNNALEKIKNEFKTSVILIDINYK